MNWFKMFCIDIIYFIYFGGGVVVVVVVVVVGHAWVLHLWVLVSRPLHPEPPPLGAGLLHFLVAFCEPPPQVLLHRLQDCHEPQLPWTTDGPPPGLPASSPWMRNTRIHSSGVIWSLLNTIGKLWLRSNKKGNPSKKKCWKFHILGGGSGPGQVVFKMHLKPF